ncbi:MAG: hypothetical protein SGCHY_005478, partial [Lobulomycetales sp.]
MQLPALVDGDADAGFSDDNDGPLVTGDGFGQTIDSTSVGDQEASGRGISQEGMPTSKKLIIALPLAFVALLCGTAVLLYRFKFSRGSKRGPKRNMLSTLDVSSDSYTAGFQPATPITNHSAATFRSVRAPDNAYDMCDGTGESSAAGSGNCTNTAGEGAFNSCGDYGNVAGDNAYNTGGGTGESSAAGSANCTNTAGEGALNSCGDYGNVEGDNAYNTCGGTGESSAAGSGNCTNTAGE